MRRRAPFAAVLALWLVGACTLPRPTIGLTIAGTDVPASREGSFCRGGGCSGACGDGPPPVATRTLVHTTVPVRLDFHADPEVISIHADVWRGETISGTPIESFDLEGARASHTSAAMSSGSYYIAVTIRWSRPLDRGDSSRACLVEIAPG